MPCWEVREVSVALEAADHDVLRRALEREFGAEAVTADAAGVLWFLAGGRRFRVVNGRLVGADADEVAELANRVKRAYAGEAVRTAAQRARWQVVQKSPTRLQVLRRY